jgi:hypothetical protein
VVRVKEPVTSLVFVESVQEVWAATSTRILSFNPQVQFHSPLILPQSIDSVPFLSLFIVLLFIYRLIDEAIEYCEYRGVNYNHGNCRKQGVVVWKRCNNKSLGCTGTFFYSL